jgi:sugar phosphate isomerase/epimerase
LNTISFITANLVAQQLGWNMTEGWMQGDTATQNHYRPLETYVERFGAMLKDVQGMGFTAIDLWGAHLHPSWATEAHLEIARESLRVSGMRVITLAAWAGSLADLEGFCRVASTLGATAIAGGAPVLHDHRSEAVAILRNYGVRLAIENHPEKTPEDVLRVIGDGADGLIGAAPDTGWWATQACDAPTALRELRDHLITVHMKDVLAFGGHDTCRFGRGVANIEGCVRVLREVGYAGNVGVEHEPERFDPHEDVIESRKLLEGWLRATEG